MISMNIFKNSAFSAVAMSGYVQKMDTVPQLLGSLGIFDPMPVRTRDIFVDRTEGNITLIPTSPDGAPPEALNKTGRDVVALKTTRLAKKFTLYASELQGIRASGSESELMQVQAEINTRTVRLNADMELTKEHHRLGALQGVLLDADGTTVIYDYRDLFDEVIPAATNFALGTATTDVHQKCKDITRSMARSGKGSLAGASVHSIAGDEFYDALTSHPNVEKFYLNQAAARDLQAEQGKIFESFRLGNITFHNYQGTDDNSTVAVPTASAKFFPIGGRDVFTAAHSPLDTMGLVNTLGQEKYMMMIPDEKRDMFVEGELYSFPLHVCQQPRLLRNGTVS